MSATSLTKRLTKRRSCGQCGSAIEQPTTGRPRSFCSDACRQRAHVRRHAKRRPVYFSRESDEWSTPRDRWDEWNAEFGFTLDAAATAGNALCADFYTMEDDGLSQEWTGNVWCNPPYSAVGKWMEKAYDTSLTGATCVLLVPARTDTRWWHQWAVRGEIRFIKGRLKFGSATTSAPFPSALIIFRLAVTS